MTENYGFNVFDLLGEYAEEIHHVESFVHDEINGFANNYRCLLIHDSYPNKEIKSKLVAVFRSIDKPVVIFSEQFPMATFDINYPKAYITGIKKSRFYHNLKYLLKNYAEKLDIKLNLLALGRGYNTKRSKNIQDKLIKNALLSFDKFDFNDVIPFEEEDNITKVKSIEEERKSELFKDWQELYFIANPSHNMEQFEIFDSECRENVKLSFDDFEDIVTNLTKKVKDD